MKRNRQKKEPGTGHKIGQKIYAAIVILLGLAIIAMTIILLFYVQKIEVKGNAYTDSQEIVSDMKEDPLSVNSLYLLVKYKFMKYEMPGSLDSMKVSLKNPWTISVKVKEKPILGYVYDDEGYVYFDKDGLVVLTGTQFIEGTPCIEGIDISKAKLYKPLDTGNKNTFTAILNVMKEVSEKQLAPDRIVSAADGIHLYFGGVCVTLGDEINSEKMAQISPIIEKLAGRSGTLHLEHYDSESTSITFDEGELPEENS